MRTRLSWEWVDTFPVFIYTTFVDHFHFIVKVVIGKENEPNARGYGPGAKGDIEYVQYGLASKKEVVGVALDKARVLLNREAIAEIPVHIELNGPLPWEDEDHE